MIPYKRPAGLGELMQMAFVPQDFDGAIQHWLNMGAGPFFLLQDIRAEWLSSYGIETPLVLDVALGNWGGMQIEIIRQKSGGRSIYSDWFDAGKESLHHICMVHEDIETAKSLCRKSGFEIVLEARNEKIEWFYADPQGSNGILIEVINTAVPASMTRDAALNWDGSDPIRVLDTRQLVNGFGE